MSRFCPGQTCDEEATDITVLRSPPSRFPFLASSPWLSLLHFLPATEDHPGFLHSSRARLPGSSPGIGWPSIDAWLVEGDERPVLLPQVWTDSEVLIDTAGLPQGTWLKLGLDLRTHLYLTFPLSCPAPPVPGKTFNKSFAYMALSLGLLPEKSGHIEIARGVHSQWEPCPLLWPTWKVTSLIEVSPTYELGLWMQTGFLFFKKEIITWGSFIMPALSLD